MHVAIKEYGSKRRKILVRKLTGDKTNNTGEISIVYKGLDCGKISKRL